MKKIAAIAVLVMSISSVSSVVSAQQAGDWALAQWRGGAQWFPGVVTNRSGNMVTIQYDDGSTETRPVNQTRPYNWRVGTNVECRWTDGEWYAARITGMGEDGLTLNVLYEDGERQRTQTGRCRSN